MRHYRRAIPIEHLRHHPNFVPLPPASTIQKLESIEDARFFRQDSWQWDALHDGRCTTSQAVAALGFLEPQAGKFLGVPRSWQHGGIGAYRRLRKPAIRTLHEMNARLCVGNSTSLEDNMVQTLNDKNNSEIWSIPKKPPAGKTTKKPYPFVAKYLIKTSEEDRQRRRTMTQKYSRNNSFGFAVRCMWGDAQEATALLTALNFFCGQDPNVLLKEVGMCGAGMGCPKNQSMQSNLIVGATPDALICYPNGTVEVLEVKNHCPFVANSREYQARARFVKRFSIRTMNFHQVGVPPHYIPQLMMEMLCVGPECQSAIMVRQSATSGAVIMRIHRDDQWIEEMLYWLHRFQNEFVEKESPPPPDFFWETGTGGDRARYRRFLEKTKELEAKVTILTRIANPNIQRSTGQRSFDPFLD